MAMVERDTHNEDRNNESFEAYKGMSDRRVKTIDYSADPEERSCESC